MEEFERLKKGQVFKSFDEFQSLIESYDQKKGYVFVITNAKAITTHNKHQVKKGLPIKKKRDSLKNYSFQTP